MAKKNLGKHMVFIEKLAWCVIRVVWEIDGKRYIKFDHKLLEVEWDRNDPRNPNYRTEYFRLGM